MCTEGKHRSMASNEKKCTAGRPRFFTNSAREGVKIERDKTQALTTIYIVPGRSVCPLHNKRWARGTLQRYSLIS